MKTFWSNQGGEYVNGTFNKFLEEIGIEHEYIVPYAHEQNGFIECDNQIVMETMQQEASCMQRVCQNTCG
jgi:transposase InsO family protein